MLFNGFAVQENVTNLSSGRVKMWVMTRPGDPSYSQTLAAVRIRLTGCVQGAGVRPSIARLAKSLNLAGAVRNTLAGLEIEVQGTTTQLSLFQQHLPASMPTGSSVEQSDVTAIAPTQRAEFVIERDNATGPLITQVPRDVAVCDECLSETRDRRDRRHLYPLTTCATCGPRFTLIHNMPFDRDHTTMDGFTLCDDCRAEYTSSSDRRFHAQTIACEVCGPQVWFNDPIEHQRKNGLAAVHAAARSIIDGKIVALRGVGGYQLLCDATNTAAVERLRQRKARPAKPFAVLVASLEEARCYAFIDDLESDALLDRSNPIVLLRARASDIAEVVRPGLNRLGLLLPSTPLHALLGDEVARPLVCTSANREGEPLEYEVDAAEVNLADIAEVWLHHDRPIARPIDDSVVQVIAGRRVALRLGRGLAPLPLALPAATPQLAVGGHMKSAIAWHNGSQAALGPHIGDLDTVATRERFEQHVADMSSLYRFEPEVAVHDLHPEYFTTRECSQRGLRTTGVQHHFAHVAAGMLEHGLLDREVLGVSWDGTGLGEDDTMWGGEFLIVDRAREYRRVAHLRPFAWHGGEIAIHQPWRVAVSLLAEAIPDDAWIERAAFMWPERPVASLLRIHRRTPATVSSTSVGRLFDAVAAIVLGIDAVQYEGQAAMMLEAVASSDALNGYSLPFEAGQLDWRAMIRDIWEDRIAGVDPAIVSARFHRALAGGIVIVAAQFPALPIVLAGGVFQNKLLTELVVEMSDDCERLKLPGMIPPNDGGLAAGQLAIAVMREYAGHRNSQTMEP
jgi:hydrogenase maturation protein HypF